QGDQDAEGHQQEHHHRSKSDVESPLQEAIGIGIKREGPHLQQRDVAEVAHLEMDLLAAGEIGDEVRADAVPFGHGDEVLNFFYFGQWQYYKGVFEGLVVEDLLEIVDGAYHGGVGIFCGPIGEEADRLDAEIFICQEVVLKLGTQLVIPD